MAANIYAWSLVAANNATSDPDLTWAEGMAPSAVNNSARVMMQRVAQLLVDLGGSTDAGGSANALTVTAASPYATYDDGKIIAFTATATNTTAATLNVNTIGAKSIRKMDGSGDLALEGGEIVSGGTYVAQYFAALNGAAGGWLLVNPTLASRGTFTPSFSASGSTFSYSGRSGAYTKIGRQVFCDVTIVLNGSGNTLTANALSVTGLPFTSSQGAGLFPIRWTNSTTNYTSFVGARVSGTSLIFEQMGGTTVTGVLANGLLSPTALTSVTVVFSYYI